MVPASEVPTPTPKPATRHNPSNSGWHLWQKFRNAILYDNGTKGC